MERKINHVSERTLLGPGPSNIHPRVLLAMAQPAIGHLDQDFIAMMNEIQELLRWAFQTENKLTIPLSAPGSAGMECCFANLVVPGETVLICQNGVFGKRMAENVLRMGGNVELLEAEWGKPILASDVENKLKENSQISIVAVVHAETSTGVLTDVQKISHLAHQYNCLTIVDAVTSLAGCELKVDEWEIDAIYSGSQKCLSCVPGLSPLSFSERAIHKMKNRKTKVQSWFMDLTLMMSYWGSEGPRAYHHTAPVNSLYALHEALWLLHEEGLEQSWERHRKNHLLLQQGLEKLGLEMIVEQEFRIPQLNAVKVPEGLDEKELRLKLLKEYNLEIGAGLGPLAGKIWRIGLMGYGSQYKNVSYCLEALRNIM